MNPLAGPTRRHGRPTFPAWLAAVGLALGLPAAAAPPDVLFPRPANPDLELTVKAKAALAADPALKGVNPVVSIVDRIAVVGGPVPSEAAAARVAEVLRGVPGLTDVRVSCWVEVPDDPLKKLVADRLKANTPAALPTPVAAAVDTLPDPRPAAQVVVQRAVPAAGVLLLDPVAPRGGRVTPPPLPTIPAPAVPVRPNQDVAAAVEVVRGADPRFAGLTAAVRGDAVVVAGRAADGDAWEFAAVVRRVPGVGRVVLGRIDGW